MLQQYIYKDKMYIIGKPSAVLEQIRALCTQFHTVKELLDAYMKELQVP